MAVVVTAVLGFGLFVPLLVSQMGKLLNVHNTRISKALWLVSLLVFLADICRYILAESFFWVLSLALFSPPGIADTLSFPAFLIALLVLCCATLKGRLASEKAHAL